ncbi:MAG: hypothetical protein HQK96_18770 [Nitrospirae bacterium]|nr:hypothetical protein [Nitrospirota bacterium]
MMKDLTPREIADMFNLFDYRDPLGHKFTQCLEFQQLVDHIGDVNKMENHKTKEGGVKDGDK